jgi:hypothetical protein
MRCSPSSAWLTAMLSCAATAQVLLHDPAPAQDPFLSNWMGELAPVLRPLSMLDITLPGTHDSMTYDLSTRVSDGANDLPPAIAWVLHEFGPIVGAVGAGGFIRDQAHTQGLSMRGQLEAGARFIDFRVMYTAGPGSGSLAAHDWYSLHLVETNQKSMAYLQELRDFLVEHPAEVVALWISRHGSQCAKGDDQYPDVKSEDKRAFWAEIRELFGPLIFDPSAAAGGTNATTLGAMVDANRRLVIYASDWADFTANDTATYDSCASLSNSLAGGGIDHLDQLAAGVQGEFANAKGKRAMLKADDSLYLVSLAGSPPDFVTEDAAEIKWDPLKKEADKTRQKCAASLAIPNMTDWCPVTLLDCEQLRSFYLQDALDATAADGAALELPGAIYLDVLGPNGTIRTGTTLLGGGGGGDDPEGTTGFGYVDTAIYFNARIACAAPGANATACAALMPMLKQRRAAYPLKHWSDPAHGRVPLPWPRQA